MKQSASKDRTSKERVLKLHPKAIAKYVGLSLKIVVLNKPGGIELSRHYLRERDAWADAAKGF